jgi:ABC-2 type transport system ATP-binding protein
MSTIQEPPVIEARDLTKRYGEATVVDRLNLAIRPGEVFGLLGPNGSGKTTTILMLLGLTELSGGTVRVLGLDPARQPLGVKRRVGYLPDSVGFYDYLTARANLRFVGRLAGIPREDLDVRIEAMLERFHLRDRADRKVATFSRGMKQRLGLAEVLLKEPRVVILDEPTAGLDPQSAQELLAEIRSLKAEGIAVMLSSHALHQVQAICDRVALFRSGRVVLEGSVATLARQVLGGAYRIMVHARGDGLAKALARVPGALRVVPGDDGRFEIEAETDLRGAIAAAVVRAGGTLLGLAVAEPSLDDIYTQYFREVRDAA